MGGIGRALFGGSKQKSSSNNQAFDYIKDALSGNVSGGNTAFSGIMDFLGLGGSDGTARSQGALKNFMDSTGFNNILDTAVRGITGNNAAKGLLRSGATGNAIANKTTDLAQQSSQNYLNNLAQLAQLGLGSANTIAGAGGVSKGSGSSQGGIIPGLFG